MAEDTPTNPPAEPTEEVVASPPAENAGSGHFAVFSHDFGRFVSGVGDKKTATAAKKALGSEGETKGHKLEVREV